MIMFILWYTFLNKVVVKFSINTIHIRIWYDTPAWLLGLEALIIYNFHRFLFLSLCNLLSRDLRYFSSSKVHCFYLLWDLHSMCLSSGIAETCGKWTGRWAESCDGIRVTIQGFNGSTLIFQVSDSMDWLCFKVTLNCAWWHKVYDLRR